MSSWPWPPKPNPPVPKPTLVPVVVYTHGVLPTRVWFDGVGPDGSFDYELTPAGEDSMGTNIPNNILAYNLHIIAEGYIQYGQVINSDGKSHQLFVGSYPNQSPPPFGISLPGLTLDFPAVPTRDQVCSLQTSFQGLIVDLDGYPGLHWFDGCITSLNPTQRQQLYAAKKAAGDTHCLIDLSWNYSESSFTYPLSPCDMSNDLDAWVLLIIEIILNGFIPVLMLAGDGDSVLNQDGSLANVYNDLGGWTYGQQWLIANLPRIISALQNSSQGDLTKYCLISPGYDGVFYGWTDPNGVQSYAQTLRSLAPNCYMMLEHTAGNPPLGEGGADFLPGGRMMSFDVVASEFSVWPTQDDTIWQIGARFLGPLYNRPSNQPSSDDPGSPFGYGNAKFYIQYLTDRGPIYVIAFEMATYSDVRGNLSHQDIINCGQYYKNTGWKLVCVPNWARL